MSKRKYDLIFGIGEACPCSQALRKYNLQFCSYPLDWVFGSDITKRVELLLSNFETLICKEDLVFMYEEKRYNCKAYKNKKNEIVFNHDFPISEDFETAYTKAVTKYNRRIERLLSRIDNAKSMLIVYLEVPSHNHGAIKNSEIQACYEKIIEKYPNKKIDLYYIQNKIDSKLEKEIVSKNITKYTLDYQKRHKTLGYLVNQEKLKIIFKDIKLNGSDISVIKKYFNKIWINLIPSKPLKEQFIKKFHV